MTNARASDLVRNIVGNVDNAARARVARSGSDDIEASIGIINNEEPKEGAPGTREDPDVIRVKCRLDLNARPHGISRCTTRVSNSRPSM